MATSSFSAMKAQIGLQGMKNQEALNAYKTWLVTRPGVHEQGFYDSAVDVQNRTMTLQWHGDSALLTQAVAEGRRRAVVGHRGRREAYRVGHLRHLAGRGVVHLHQHLAMDDLGMGEALGEIAAAAYDASLSP